MRWRDHLERQILPWWEAHGVDDHDGGVFTGFDNAGRATTTDKLTWSQGRWAWVCAELARETAAGRLGGDPAVWRDRALATAARLDRIVGPDATLAFATDRAGRPVPSGQRSVYADLFAVLGWAGTLGFSPDARRQGVAETVLLAAERVIAERTAPTDPYPVPTGFVELAGPMCLLHAAAELARHTDSGQAAGVRDRALTRLLGPQGLLGDDTWWEFRPDDPAADPTLLARHRTPGHLLECVWMVVHAQAGVGVRPDAARLASLALEAWRIGRDDEHGGLLRYADRSGGVPRGTLLGVDYEGLVRRTWDTKLWWVHVEALYAFALLATLPLPADTRADLHRAHAEIADYALSTFPDPDGEWLQIRDRTGHPLDEVVALPVKDPFHIIRSLVLLNRLDADTPEENWS